MFVIIIFVKIYLKKVKKIYIWNYESSESCVKLLKLSGPGEGWWGEPRGEDKSNGEAGLYLQELSLLWNHPFLVTIIIIFIVGRLEMWSEKLRKIFLIVIIPDSLWFSSCSLSSPWLHYSYGSKSPSSSSSSSRCWVDSHHHNHHHHPHDDHDDDGGWWQVTELIEESCLAGSRGENKVPRRHRRHHQQSISSPSLFIIVIDHWSKISSKPL